MVRVRHAKGKRWRKGQSCSSNPESRKHRDAAKNATFSFAKQGEQHSNLTVAALSKHDGFQDVDDDVELQDDEGFSVKSGKTFGTLFTVSGLTDCSMPVFDAVKRFWDSPASHHKEVCAVLAAVTEVIKTKGGKETETEYFAALMTALEAAEEEDALTAIAFLLSLVIKRVPEGILKAKFSKTCKILIDILGSHTTGGTGLLKSLLNCLCHLLSVPEGAVWGESSTMMVYNGFLSFVVHAKPKVRKTAQDAVKKILETPPANMDYHPATTATTKFCVQHIERHGGSSQAVTTLHVICFLREIMQYFPAQNVKSACECLLKLMTLGNVMVTVNALQAIHNLLSADPRNSTLNKELNAQMINALFDYQPSVNDIEMSQAWMATMEKAYTNLVRLDQNLCSTHLPRFFTSAMTYFLSDHTVLVKTAGNTMKDLLHNCVAPIAEKLGIEVSRNPNSSNTPAHKIVKCLESGLQYRYQASWGTILEVLEVLFEVLGKQCPQLTKKIVISLCDLRGTHQFPFIHQLDRAVGMAIQRMGPRNVLEVVPLQLDKHSPTCNFPRSWLLPVLKDNVKDTELKFFFEKMLPLSAKLREKASSLKESGQHLESKVYDTLQLQIWSLLPGFCTRPVDLCQSFKSVARILGTALTERPDLRLTVCQALRLLVSKNTENVENTKEVALYAKNYLPILFNLYSADSKEGDPDKLPILETIRTYLTIADHKLVTKFFPKALEKMQSEETEVHTRRCMMDLVIAMIPYVDQKNLETLFNLTVPWLQVTDITQQKKAYRFLEQICSASSEASAAFVASHLEKLQNILLKTLASSSSASKTPRLRCLSHIVQKLDGDQEDFIRAIVPEVILCIKEVAIKARTTALSLLINCCNALSRCSGKSKGECISSYLDLVVAGLAGSHQMISATIIAISRVLYEFRGEVPHQVLEQLIKAVMVCLGSSAKAVVKSSLGFFKVVISVMRLEDLLPFVPDLVSGLVTWNEENRRRFRFNVKVLFERLIRKLGYNTIYKCTPEKHRKLVVNIHKTTQRLKRQKTQRRVQTLEDDADKLKVESYEDLMFGSDSEDEVEGAQSGKSKKNLKMKERSQGPKSWIREGAEEEPVDFLDKNVVQRIVATDPGKRTKRRRDADFQTAKDGRLIIPDEDEDEAHEPGSKRKTKSIESDPMDLEEDEFASTKKRRKTLNDDMDDDSDEDGSKVKTRKGKGAFGAEYKAKKAAGDMRKKGKPDPYAYMPLNRAVLNKRKNRKVAGQFRGLVRATRKGAAYTRHKRPVKK